MSIVIKVPMLPESIADATVATWHKKVGDKIKRGENIVDLETDKVMLEVPSPADGVLEKIIAEAGAVVEAEATLGQFNEQADASEQKPSDAKPEHIKESQHQPAEHPKAGPKARQMAEEMAVDLTGVRGSGPSGRITSHDISTQQQQASQPTTAAAPAAESSVKPPVAGARASERVPMSRLRQRVAERLLAAQQQAAILTTFNDVDMQPVIQMRQRYQERFQKQFGVKLGFMSLFIRATVEALKKFPAVNAAIDGSDLIYHGFYDIGVAVSTERGLVVPILRNVDQLSLADIEKQILSFSAKAREAKLDVADMTGGTFTISNGGVFGSMLSTPIINPPQSAILGMHRTEERPVVRDGAIVIRPMMYLALSYDHRIIDGQQSVGFLKQIKDLLEDPTRLWLGF